MVYLLKSAEFSLGVIGPEVASVMTEMGVPAVYERVGSYSIGQFCRRFLGLRRGQSISALLDSTLFPGQWIRRIGPGDIVISYETMGIVPPVFSCCMPREIVRRGARYVPWFQDAWPLSSDPVQVRACDDRMDLCDFALAVSPGLTSLLRERHPSKRVELFEEGIPVSSFSPEFDSRNNDPVVIWNGPFSKIHEVESFASVLSSVYKEIPFRFRIVSGKSRPKISLPIPFEFAPFRGTSYADQFKRAEIAFSRYSNDPYSQCKGNYKVKTYLAAGCAVITSPVGYNRELIQPGINGYFAESDQEWTQILLMLLQNSELRRRIRTNARNGAVKRFSYASQAKQLVEVLRRVDGVV